MYSEFVDCFVSEGNERNVCGRGYVVVLSEVFDFGGGGIIVVKLRKFWIIRFVVAVVSSLRFIVDLGYQVNFDLFDDFAYCFAESGISCK
jgi:hypothetical protein